MDICKPYSYILQIVLDGSISVAAESLHISQPALSKYIRKIENEIGAEIFDRSSTPLALTEAGRCYVDAAKKIIDADAQMHKELDEIKQSRNASMRLGISPSRAPYLLPGMLKDFSAGKSIRIEIVEATTNELNEMLSCGDLDLIISIREKDTEAFECVHLFDEKVLLAVPEFYAGASLEEVIASCTMISSGKGQPMWSFQNDMQKVIGPLASLLQCQNMFTALSLVSAGVGITLVPSYMRDYGVSTAGVAYLELPQKYSGGKRDVCIFYRKEQYLSSSEREFIQYSCEAVREK